jgi:hypothetical protein
VNKLYGPAAKTHLQKLNTIHNVEVGLSLADFCTSPIDSLLADACMPDLELKQRTKDLKIVGKALKSERPMLYKKPPQLSKVAKGFLEIALLNLFIFSFVFGFNSLDIDRKNVTIDYRLK